MRFLFAGTGIGAIAVALATTPATAETVISTAVTTPVATGTANDDLRITSTGSVKPVGGAAVTINTNDSAVNEGTIAVQGANGSAGIVGNANVTGNITNSGTITIDENYTATDGDNDGDLDGPFAQGSDRYGIHVLGGGTFTGSILGSGAITVEGNNSAAIAVDSALTGSITQSAGAISVVGNDSFGIRAGDVSGNVHLVNGSVQVQGGNAVGVTLDGDIGGALVIQNTVRSTGYRSTTAPADTSKLDADDLLQGGSAVVVGGNVAGGILFDAKPADNSTTDTDEDDDGIADANEGTASISSFGSAAAVRIGSSTQDVSIGAVTSSADGHGLVIKGSISGSGVYKGVSATGLHIGGTGHAVNIADGMTVGGTVSAKAVEANATAVRIGAGSSVPAINVTGSVTAEGAGTASTAAQAILIESGATVATLRNSGTIGAVRSGSEGTAAAIVDKSGTLALIENSGTITVASSALLGDKAVAFDLTANSSGATVRQLVAASGKPAPSISGTMLFGSGNDVFDIADGTVSGAAKFGAGNNSLSLSGDTVMAGAVTFGGGADTLQLAGTSSLTGDIDFGGGSDVMALAGPSVFSGKLTGSSGLAVTVGAGSTLDVTNIGQVDIASLTTGSGATLGVSVDSVAGAATLYNVAGDANFGANTSVDVKLLNLGGVEGTYKIIDAGTLTGAENLTSSSASLPFLYDSSLLTGTPGEVSLVIELKTAEELGLNDSEGAILEAVVNSADADEELAAVFLGIQDGSSLSATLQQMLPEHAGGAFETATKGSRLTAGILSEPGPSSTGDSALAIWLQQVAWGTSKSIGSTSSYDLTGWGAAAGIERRMGAIGALGISLAYLTGRDGWAENQLTSNQYEGGIYWRGDFGPFHGFARGTVGTIDFDSERNFTGTVGDSEISRTTEGEWTGRLYSAVAGVSYLARMGRLSLRPSATFEHYKLTEKGYTESGGGEAFDLTVHKRSSDETAATAMLGVGYDLLSLDPSQPWMRIEIQGGRRQILSGDLGKTTASFGDGDPFTLTPEERTSGWRAALRAVGGGPGFAISAEVSGEEQQGEASIGARAGVHFAL
jgi:autotransporter-like protein